MRDYIETYVTYLNQVKHASKNTISSYQRDLIKLEEYLSKNGKLLTGVSSADLETYILFLEKEGLSQSTISRSISSIKSFYLYLFKQGLASAECTDQLKPPKLEKRVPETLSEEEVATLLRQPDGKSPKEIRDKAMLELLYATGLRVSELISLKVRDVNLGMGYVLCRENARDRVIPVEETACKALKKYMDKVRPSLCQDTEYLFCNMKGDPMSRQGFWKLIKAYAKKARITKEITPHMIRHSFATHLVSHGADIRAVQAMMGHSDVSSTQIYLTGKAGKIKEEYDKAHLRPVIKKTNL